MHTETKSGTLYKSLTGVENVGELIEIGTGTWEVHNPLQGSSIEVERQKEGAWMAESAIVAIKRLILVEPRAGRK